VRREDFSSPRYSRRMDIALITSYLPYLPATRNGNAHTALRWRRLLRLARLAGHRVDLTIALHARRVHAALARFATRHPDRPLILVTDLYRDIHIDADAQRSLQRAHRIVVLQERGISGLPIALRAKARVIFQSASHLKAPRRPICSFDVCVVAHLREEKDPFPSAPASRLLPEYSRVRIHHVGGPLEEGMAEESRGMASACPRWHWLGSLSHGEARRKIARSLLLVLGSRTEGGANVIREALTAGTPVLVSNVPGVDYAGYFPQGDGVALADLSHRTETDPMFYRRPAEQCAERAPLFDPAREAALVRELVEQCRCA
jgi:putative glycosyltransferase (TIGR04348 family)